MNKKNCDLSYGAKLLRLFRILLADNRRHYLSDLKKTLDCSSQTLLRLTEEIALETGENFVTGKDGRQRWYQLKPLIKQGRLMLDNDDIAFFELCRDLADPYLPQQVKTRVDGKIWDLSLRLSEEIPQGFGHGAFAFFSKGYIDYSPFFEMIMTLLEAIRGNRICVVRYKPSGNSRVNRHFFAPCKIASMSGALYVLGSYMSKDLKSSPHLAYYAVHRLVDVTLTDNVAPFAPPAISYESFGLPWHEPMTFKIKFKPGKSTDYVKERIWAQKQRLIDTEDGGVILEITTTSRPELESWVRSFGGEAQLLESAPAAADEMSAEDREPPKV